MSRRRPSITIRWTQDLVPEGAMCRKRPAPSPCLPGLLIALTESALSFPILQPCPHIFPHNV